MKKSRWLLVAIVAALVAVATTAVIFALRARAKKKALFNRDECGFDYDECQSFEFDDNGELIEEPVAAAE
jgi:lipopolysaccharide export system protein LptC